MGATLRAEPVPDSPSLSSLDYALSLKIEGGRDEIPALLELILRREELETTGKKLFLLHRTEKQTGAGPGGAGEGARADAPRAGSWFEAESSNGKTGGTPRDETLRGHPGDTQHRNQSHHVWAVPWCGQEQVMQKEKRLSVF